MITPVEYKLVIMCDPIAEESAGGIAKPKQAIEAERRDQTEGELIAKSDMCFTDGDSTPWKCKLPKIGDRVMFTRYSGQFITEDGVEYRVMNDKDVIAILK